MKTERVSLSRAIIEFLKQQHVVRDGVESKFFHGMAGIFGHGNVAGLGQALQEFGGKELPHLLPRNEQAMVHTAAAFAKTRKRLAAYACTTSVGPGATNMITGAAGATTNRLPVLLLPSDVFSNRRPNPVLQQLEYPQSPDVSVNDCFRPVSKLWDRINRPEQILYTLPEVMRVLTDPAETGAVTVCLPEDVQTEAFDCPVEFLEKKVTLLYRAPIAPDALSEAARRIRASKQPLIIAGGGVHYSDALNELRLLAEMTGLPVSGTQAGKGALSETHPQGVGGIGVTGTAAANALAEQSDLVICIGTRLSDFTTASKTQFRNPQVKFIHLNICALDAWKLGALPLVGDARLGLEELAKSLVGWSVPKEHKDRIAAAKQDFAARYAEITKPHPQGRLSQAEVIRIVNESIGKNATIVHAAGGLPGDLHKLWISRAPNDYHSEYAYSCMGYEIAGALGIKLAYPSREVYAMVGDGSYLMLNHELSTSIQEQKKITAILLDNQGYQCIHSLQRSRGGKSFGNEFAVEVDFKANARSLGAVVFEAHDAASLKKSITDAKKEPRSCVIYAQVDGSLETPGYSWWDVPPNQESKLAPVQEARRQHEAFVSKHQRTFL